MSFFDHPVLFYVSAWASTIGLFWGLFTREREGAERLLQAPHPNRVTVMDLHREVLTLRLLSRYLLPSRFSCRVNVLRVSSKAFSVTGPAMPSGLIRSRTL